MSRAAPDDLPLVSQVFLGADGLDIRVIEISTAVIAQLHVLGTTPDAFILRAEAYSGSTENCTAKKNSSSGRHLVNTIVHERGQTSHRVPISQMEVKAVQLV